MSVIQKWKHRWGIHSTWRFWIIMLVFSLTGMSFVFIRRPVYAILHLTPDQPLWLRIAALFLIGLPLYQVMLLCWGALFGQFHFFLAFERKSLNRLASLLHLKRPAPVPSPPSAAPSALPTPRSDAGN